MVIRNLANFAPARTSTITKAFEFKVEKALENTRPEDGLCLGSHPYMIPHRALSTFKYVCVLFLQVGSATMHYIERGGLY